MIELFTTENAIALLTLSSLEVVLGIDNIVFITILTGKLPPEQQARGRQLGLALAMGMRIALLLAISWVMGLTQPLFDVLDHQFSGRDVILLVGGLFLLAKATWEIHDKLEGEISEVVRDRHARRYASFAGVMVQVAVLDMVFSLDSVITAVGMARDIEIMVAAVVIAVLVMMAFAGSISRFVERHPTLKMLALSFLILIGAMLVLEGFGKHVEKGYIYFAIAFSLGVEMLNLRVRRARTPLRLKQSYVEGEPVEE
jgi:predicted tellurium resistance membrane protein TerC